ncbi:hypothetical protein Hypma_011751 [Hypsizygus marmoreus]|uniref:Uncharacterized protein n=1 Tax=Hypsizygus marmoreus TaxID=39966 RepID=A0A369JQZ5_HYPMA|nr:hypothetical protein Hypma_011751 [Hypsizygus marmoreus]
MEPGQPPPAVAPAPVGTSIQIAADMLVALVESQREEAAASAREQLQKLEHFFHAFRQQTMTMHAAEQAQVSDARQKLVDMQTRFTEFQQNFAMPTTSAPLPLSRQIEIAPDQSNNSATHTPHEEEESLVKKHLDELQSALRGVGIVFSSEENTLRFEAEWAAVLAELGAQDLGVMNPTAFNELLGRLHRRLQGDRETIAQLQQKVIASEEERKQVANGYEMEIAALRLEISMMQDNAAAAPQSQVSESLMPARSPSSTQATDSQVSQADPTKRPGSSDVPAVVKRHKPEDGTPAKPPDGPFIDLRSVYHRRSR